MDRISGCQDGSDPGMLLAMHLGGNPVDGCDRLHGTPGDGVSRQPEAALLERSITRAVHLGPQLPLPPGLHLSQPFPYCLPVYPDNFCLLGFKFWGHWYVYKATPMDWIT